MKTSHFGSNRSYGLSKAILLYSDGQETFATVHEPKNSPDGGPPYLDAGEPLTVEFLRQLAKGLGQTVAREILPANILARTPDMMVWWTRPQRRVMFFSESSDGRTLNGKIFPQPPLVFRVCGSELAVRALVPDSAALANDLAVSCMRMGDLNRSLGEQARAVEFYQKAVGPSEELRRRAPNVAEYASNLLWVYDRLGGAALELGRLGAAGADYRRVLELLDDFERHFPGFRLEPSMSNSGVRAHFREQLGRAESPGRRSQK